MAYLRAKSDMGTIEIPKSFIDKYLCSADGNFVKVYLLGLSQCGNDDNMPLNEFANELSMIQSDVIRAWKYWESLGIVKITYKNKDKTDFNIEFQDIDAASVIKQETKPVYTPDEIYSCASESPELKEMFSISEKILGKHLSSTDINVLYSLYDYYRLPTDVIPMLLMYCVKMGKKSMRQIEKIAQSWVDLGINNLECTEKYIKKMEKYNSRVSKLKSALGIGDRSFTPTEEKYIKLWTQQMGLSNELIAYAYDITVVNTGKLSVKYMDKILNDWHNNGVKTPLQANEYKNSRKTVAVKTNGKNSCKFEKKDFDYDAIEARALGKK